jgi:myo-inositol catabolism protein IolC
METPSAAHPLMILALDHRDSYEKTLFHVDPAAIDEAALATMRRHKTLVYEGLMAARDDLGDGIPGVLVDELLGAQVQQRAHQDGVVLAIPVEKSGEKIFVLEYGDETPQHVERTNPDYVKVLVRMNPDDDPDDTRLQLERLAELSSWLHSVGKPLLYELLVPPSEKQLAEMDHNREVYDRSLRPRLVADIIKANYYAGVEPALWKIEGLETADDARDVVRAARAGGRDEVACIVLGRDAPQDRLDHWLKVAAGVDGFVGFAIGRSIWQDAIEAHLKDGDDASLTATVSANYRHYAKTYLDAR